jgi:hypothetical protein
MRIHCRERQPMTITPRSIPLPVHRRPRLLPGRPARRTLHRLGERAIHRDKVPAGGIVDASASTRFSPELGSGPGDHSIKCGFDRLRCRSTPQQAMRQCRSSRPPLGDGRERRDRGGDHPVAVDGDDSELRKAGWVIMPPEFR